MADGTNPLPWLRMFPPAVCFKDAEANTVYTAEVTLRNADSRPHTVKIIKPKSKRFHLVANDFISVRLSPGLTTTFEVAFATDEENDFWDACVVQTEVGTAELPLEARAPASDVVVTGDLDLGVVALGNAVSSKLVVRNRGARPAPFHVEWDRGYGEQVKIEPDSGTVPAGETAEIRVACSPVELGALDLVVDVAVDGGRDKKPFPLAVMVVPHAFELLEDGPDAARMKEMAFGNVLYGDSKKMSCAVYNNGPVAARFAVRAAREEDLARAMVTAAGEVGFSAGGGGAAADAFLRFEPEEGTLAPYERRTITFELRPSATSSTRGFKSQTPSMDDAAETLKYLGVVTFEGHRQRLMLPMTARATRGCLALDPPALDFGPVACHDAGDHLLNVKNVNREMAVDFTVSRTTFFKPTPASGRILPGQTASVVIRYEPKDLGPHVGELVVRAVGAGGGTAQETRLGVRGIAHVVGEKPALVGGTTAIPSDFERERKYVNPLEVGKATVAMSKAGRAKPVATLDRPETLERYRTLDRDNGHTLTYAQARAKDAHKTGYVEYIRKSRAARVGTKTDPTDATSLGLRGQYRGGVDRGPKLPDPNEPLWLDPAEAAKDHAYVRPRNRPQQSVDADERAIFGGATKFKTHPTTAEERRACGRVLIPKEVAKLSCGPATLDFGQISVQSENVKYFAVTNGTDAAVHARVELDSATGGGGDGDDRALSAGGPVEQVIPAGATANFAAKVRSTKVGAFRRTVTYVINSNRSTTYTFDVVADVVPVALELNTAERVFRFTPENWDATVREVVVVSNPGKDAARFEWSVPEGSAFAVEPTTGEVKGGGIQPVAITWTPRAAHAENVSTLTMRVVGDDAPRRLRCVGEAGDPRLVFKEKALRFGAVPAGFARTLTATLRNPSEHDAVFTVDERHERTLDDSSDYGAKVSCEPMIGRIPPGGRVDLDVTLHNPTPGKHDLPMRVYVRGGPSVTLRALADAVEPDVTVKQNALKFGSVFVGSVKRKRVTLRNASEVYASLKCDLRPFPEFDIELPNDNWNPEEYDDPPVLRVPKLAQNPFGNRALNRMKMKSSKKIMESRGAEDKGGNLYKIAVAPNQELTFDLVFHPSKASGAETFALPMLLEGVARQPDPERMCKPVSCDGVEPRIKLSETVINFGQKIILREGYRKMPYVFELTVSHNDPTGPESFHWSFGKPADVSKETPSHGRELDIGTVFTFEPRVGVLARGESTTVKCTFFPRDAMLYAAVVPVYLDGGAKTKSTYIEFEVNGEGAHPRLAFDAREVRLAPAPLGVRTTRRFHIINKGFDNLHVTHRLPADTGKIPMELKYPEGQMIGVAKQRLPVEVSFISKKPLSFTAAVDFLDEDGNRFSVPVSGVADNCALTLESFVEANADVVDDRLRPKDNDPARPVVLAAAPEGEPEYRTPTAEALDEGVDGANLARWIDATTPKGPLDVNDLTNAMRRSRGRLLVELVEYWSGKELVGKVLNFSPKPRTACEQLLGQYEKILTYLKASGALLNAVKPEMLLDSKDFHRLCQGYQRRVDHREVSLVEADRMQLWIDLDATPQGREEMLKIAGDAWRTVLTQTIKIFVLSRVTPKQFRATPGLEPELTAGPDSSLAGSNFFSVPETILLKWLSLHFAAVFPTGPLGDRVLNFGADLADGLVFYALLIRHWPALESRYRDSVVLRPSSREDVVRNADTILSMLQALKLPYGIDAESLADMRPSERLLFVLFLYNVLPHLIPKQAIEFPCKLGARAVKKIELANPSAKAVSYAVRLEGCADFSADKSVVRLQPNGKTQLPVTFAPTTSVPESCRLILSSLREGSGAAAATLVFALEPDVLVDAPVKVITVRSKCYELTDVAVHLENPYPGDCDFVIACENLGEGAEGGDDDAGAARASFTGRVKTRKKDLGGALGAASGGARSLPPVDRSVYPDAFGVERKSVKLRKGDSARLDVAFLPFAMGAYAARLTFEDSTHGRFAYEIRAEAEHPPPMARVRADVDVRPQTHDVTVAFTNPPLEHAKRLFLEKHPLNKIKAQADLVRAAATTVPKQVEYAVQTHSAYMDVYENITLVQNPTKGRTEHVTHGEHRAELWIPGDNNMKLALNLRNPGSYPGKVVLASKHDVRVIDLEFHAGTKDDDAALEFECCVRQSIVQEIPLVNSGRRVMSVNAKFSGDVEFFAGVGRDLVVPPGQKVLYPLQFRPLKPGTFVGKLTLKTGDESITYTLRGVADEPLCEGTVIIDAVARRKSVKNFVVPNVFGAARSVIYEVSSDLDFVGGTPRCSVPAGEEGYYDMELSPLSSGVFRGTLTFTASNGYYCWFAVEVRAAPPDVEDTLRLTVPVRRAVTVQITLKNPTPKPAVFRVDVEGHGLLGAPALKLPGDAAGAYELVYSPLLPGAARGMVRFRSSTLGEFWYAVDAHAQPAETETVPEMRSEVGGEREKVTLRVENPLGEEVTLDVASDNGRNFRVDPPRIALPPFGKNKFTVEYAPSHLGELETGTITATNPEAGTWRWAVSGRGAEPTRMRPTDIFVILGETGSGHVAFPNPFGDDATVTIRLETDEPAGVFELLTSKAKHAVPGFGVAQFPFRFRPERMERHVATLVVETVGRGEGRDVAWRYPIHAHAEGKPSGHFHQIKTKARRTTEMGMAVTLAGLKMKGLREAYSFEIAAPDSEKSHLKKALSVKPLQAEILSSTAPLKFHVSFRPKRALRCTVDLLITKASGGRWRFPLHLEATEPEVDGTVQVESHVGNVAAVVFNLPNPELTAVPFTAYFTPDSPAEFAVTPERGVMEPGVPRRESTSERGAGPVARRRSEFGVGVDVEPDGPGAQFRITYAPTEYGTDLVGRLVIVTDENTWVFEVVGTIPEYAPPRGGAKVTTRLEPGTEEALREAQRKRTGNIVLQNTKKEFYTSRRLLSRTTGAKGK